MDLPSLAVILQATLSHNPDEQKAAEQSLNQFQCAPQHLVRLLQIIVDNNCDMGVRRIASIHFKNFVAEHWCCADSDTHQKILQSDKDTVKDHILMFITQVPPLLRYNLVNGCYQLYVSIILISGPIFFIGCSITYNRINESMVPYLCCGFFLKITMINSSDSLRLRYENLLPSFEASLKHVARVAAGEREWRQNHFN